MVMFVVDHGLIHDMTNNQLINTFPPNAAMKNGNVHPSEYSVVHLLIIFCLSCLITLILPQLLIICNYHYAPPIIDYLLSSS